LKADKGAGSRLAGGGQRSKLRRWGYRVYYGKGTGNDKNRKSEGVGGKRGKRNERMTLTGERGSQFENESLPKLKRGKKTHGGWRRRMVRIRENSGAT